MIDITPFTQRDRDGVDQTILEKQTVSLRGVYVYDYEKAYSFSQLTRCNLPLSVTNTA